MSRWSAIVINWNGGSDTSRCLDSLTGFDEVVVVDNGSTDGSLELLRKRSDIVLVEAGTNRGFSGGNNLGIRLALDAGADWVVLVNNDAVVEPGAADALRAAAGRHPRAGVLAGKLLFPDGRVQWAGQRVDLRTGYSGRPTGYGCQDGPALQAEGQVDRAVGALMAVSRPAMEAAGLLDEDFFAYVEDVDWSLRVREAGYGCVFVPSARAIHALSGSTGGFGVSTAPLYYGTRNTIALVERHRPLSRLRTVVRRGAIVTAFGLHAALVLRSPSAMRAVRDGLRDASAGRLGERPPVTAQRR